MLGQFWLKGLKRAWTFVVGGALFIIHFDMRILPSITRITNRNVPPFSLPFSLFPTHTFHPSPIITILYKK